MTIFVAGPFEEEKEGIGVASDVVNVQGEDLATPGSRARKKRRGFSPGAGHAPLGLPLRPAHFL